MPEPTTHTVSIDVHGGVAYLVYDHQGPRVLQPGDTLSIQIRDYDCDDDTSLPRDEDGAPYAAGDDLTFTIVGNADCGSAATVAG